MSASAKASTKPGLDCVRAERAAKIAGFGVYSETPA